MQVLWFVLSALLLLILFWGLSQWLDTKHSTREKKSQPPGHGFDATTLQPRLRKVRQDYGEISLQRHRRTPGHDLIVLAVRRSLAKLSYFRSVEARRTQTQELKSQPGSD